MLLNCANSTLNLYATSEKRTFKNKTKCLKTRNYLELTRQYPIKYVDVLKA